MGTHDGLKQGVGQLLPVHVESALEEPVTAVLTTVRILGERSWRRKRLISQARAGLFTSLNNTMSICTQEGMIIKYSINIDFLKQSQDKPRLDWSTNSQPGPRDSWVKRALKASSHGFFFQPLVLRYQNAPSELHLLD